MSYSPGGGGTGPPGPQGPQGDTGNQGPQGNTGNQGPPGASPEIKTTTITAPYDSLSYSEVIADAVVTAGSKIILSWGTTTPDDENTPDMLHLSFQAAASSGQFTATISSVQAFGGPIKLNYIIG